jgi:hypothetical protein
MTGLQSPSASAAPAPASAARSPAVPSGRSTNAASAHTSASSAAPAGRGQAIAQAPTAAEDAKERKQQLPLSAGSTSPPSTSAQRGRDVPEAPLSGAASDDEEKAVPPVIMGTEDVGPSAIRVVVRKNGRATVHAPNGPLVRRRRRALLCSALVQQVVRACALTDTRGHGAV